MQIATDLANQLEKYLNLSSAELKVTASNMANIDTPGYKTRGFDFNQSMQSALSISNREDGNSQTAIPQVGQVDGLIARPDGNNVSMDREGLNLAEAQLKFRLGIELLNKEYAGVSAAIHSDTK
jgi:flagellar basal-body rod protein FlgB